LKNDLRPDRLVTDEFAPIYRVPVDNYFKLRDAYVTLPVFLRYELFAYEDTDRPVRPARVLNDEKAFYNWYFQ
jgi:hypothetical protein